MLVRNVSASTIRTNTRENIVNPIPGGRAMTSTQPGTHSAGGLQKSLPHPAAFQQPHSLLSPPGHLPREIKPEMAIDEPYRRVRLLQYTTKQAVRLQQVVGSWMDMRWIAMEDRMGKVAAYATLRDVRGPGDALEMYESMPIPILGNGLWIGVEDRDLWMVDSNLFL